MLFKTAFLKLNTPAMETRFAGRLAIAPVSDSCCLIVRTVAIALVYIHA
jgi:hypothetical protein